MYPRRGDSQSWLFPKGLYPRGENSQPALAVPSTVVPTRGEQPELAVPSLVSQRASGDVQPCLQQTGWDGKLPLPEGKSELSDQRYVPSKREQTTLAVPFEGHACPSWWGRKEIQSFPSGGMGGGLPPQTAEPSRATRETASAGCSIEDWTGTAIP